MGKGEELDLRDYGLPEGTPVGTPVARKAEGPSAAKGCPNCGCKELMSIAVAMKIELIRGGKGMGTYLGCPACPWASPMLILSDNPETFKPIEEE